MFAAASSLVYWAVSYYRIISSLNIKISFIIRKPRLPRLNEKSLTTLKLELQAAIVASTLKVKFLEERNLKIKRIYLCTETKTVLKYIRKENKCFTVYITYWVSKIRSNSDIKYWDFINGSINGSEYCIRPLS